MASSLLRALNFAGGAQKSGRRPGPVSLMACDHAKSTLFVVSGIELALGSNVPEAAVAMATADDPVDAGVH